MKPFSSPNLPWFCKVRNFSAELILLLALPSLTAAGLNQRNYTAAPTKNMLLDMGDGCRIRVEVPTEAQGGALRANPINNARGRANVGLTSPPRAMEIPYEDVFSMRFACFSVEEDVTSEKPVRFDAAKKKWVRDTRAFFEAFGEDLEPEWRKKFDRAIRFHELQAVNARGFAYTEDDAIGDERGRRRHLSYCLFHAQKAICGESTMALISMIRQHPGNDLTPLALRILRSIEFLDDHDTGSRPDPAASGPAQVPAGAR